MVVKLLLLNRLWDKIEQTNFNENSKIHIPFKMIWNMIKIILFVDSKLLEGFTIWPSINGTLLLDYTKSSNLVCIFNISEDKFSMSYGKYALTDKYTVDSGEFSVKTIKQHIKDFKTEYE
jgi:hypothetical protein